MTGTSFARLLPPLNSFTHTPDPPMSSHMLRQKVAEVLTSVNLVGGQDGEQNSITIAPRSVTWSRAARRQAARNADTSGTAGVGIESDVPALFRAEILFLEASSADGEASTAGDGHDAPGASSRGASVKLVWHEGRDRSTVEALWKFILTKAQMVGHGDR
jgi:methyltransferase